MADLVVLKQTVLPTTYEVVCFDLCHSFIVVSNRRGSLRLLKPITHKLIAEVQPKLGGGLCRIQRVCISPDEQLLACVTSIGDVLVVQAWSGRVLCCISDHRQHCVISLVWHNDGDGQQSSIVFVGDDDGLVTRVNVPHSKMSALFGTPCMRLLQLESAVTQMDYNCSQLLVCTRTAAFLCDTQQETCTRVGSRPSHTTFGGCFFMIRGLGAGSQEGKGETETLKDMKEQERDVQEERDISNMRASFYLGDALDEDEEEKMAESNVCAEVRLPAFNDSVVASQELCSSGSSETHSTCSSSSNLISQYNNYSVGSIKTSVVVNINSKSSESGIYNNIPLSLCSAARFNTEELHCFTGHSKSRVWEANLSGEVLRTHQFSAALALPPLPLYDENQSTFQQGKAAQDRVSGERCQINIMTRANDCCPTSNKSKDLFLSFRQILRFQNKYLLLVCSRGLYGVDPTTSTVVFFIPVLPLEDLRLCGNTLLYTSVSGELVQLTLVSPEVGIISLHSSRLLHGCAHLATQYMHLFQRTQILSRMKHVIIRDILTVIRDPELTQAFQSLKDDPAAGLIGPTFNGVVNSSSCLSLPSMKAKESLRSAVTLPSSARLSRPCSPLFSLTPRSPMLGLGMYAGLPPSVDSGSALWQDMMASVAASMAPSLRLTAVANRLADIASQSDKVLGKHVRGVDAKYALVEEQAGKAEGEQSKNASNCILGVQDINAFEATDNSSDSKFVLDLESDMTDKTRKPLTESGNSGVVTGGDLIVERKPRQRRKKHHRLRSGCRNISLDIFSHSTSISNNENEFQNKSIINKSSENDAILTGILQNFRDAVEIYNEKLSSTQGDASKVTLLNVWLHEYVKVLNSLYVSNSDKALLKHIIGQFVPPSSGSLNSKVTTAGLQAGITNLVIQCLYYRSSLELPAVNFPTTFSSNFHASIHCMAIDFDKKLDKFFSLLVNCSWRLIECVSVVNALHAVGVHYYVRLWHVLLARLLEEIDSSTVETNYTNEILQNNHVSRSQRLVFMHHYLLSNDVINFLDAALRFHHVSVIFDVALLSNQFSSENNSNQNINLTKSTLVHLEQTNNYSIKADSTYNYQSNISGSLLFHYLNALSQHHSLASLYCRHWCSSSELQYDIVECILESYAPHVRTCLCGAPLPTVFDSGSGRQHTNSYSKNNVSATAADEDYNLTENRKTENVATSSIAPCDVIPNGVLQLLFSVLSMPLYDPSAVSRLCRRYKYWPGQCRVDLYYSHTAPHRQLMADSLQTCCSATVSLLMEAVGSRQLPDLFQILAEMSLGVVNDEQLCCYRCRSIVEINPVCELSVTAVKEKKMTSSNLSELRIISEKSSRVNGGCPIKTALHSKELADDSFYVNLGTDASVTNTSCLSTPEPPAAMTSSSVLCPVLSLSGLWCAAVMRAVACMGAHRTLLLLYTATTNLTTPALVSLSVLRSCIAFAAVERRTPILHHHLQATACLTPAVPLQERQRLYTLALEFPNLPFLHAIPSSTTLVGSGIAKQLQAVIASPAGAASSKPTGGESCVDGSAAVPAGSAVTGASRLSSRPVYGLRLRLRGGLCLACGRPLMATTMLSAPPTGGGDAGGGLTAFKCSHVYHTICLQAHGYRCAKDCFI